MLQFDKYMYQISVMFISKFIVFTSSLQNDPDRTASSFVGDYYLTGDKATMDKDGYLWFVGRGDDVITSAG